MGDERPAVSHHPSFYVTQTPSLTVGLPLFLVNRDGDDGGAGLARGEASAARDADCRGAVGFCAGRRARDGGVRDAAGLVVVDRDAHGLGARGRRGRRGGQRLGRGGVVRGVVPLRGLLLALAFAVAPLAVEGLAARGVRGGGFRARAIGVRGLGRVAVSGVGGRLCGG